MSDDSVAKSAAETKVEYRRLGSSGLKVSVPILGAMSFGDPRWMPWVLDEEKVQRAPRTHMTPKLNSISRGYPS